MLSVYLRGYISTHEGQLPTGAIRGKKLKQKFGCRQVVSYYQTRMPHHVGNWEEGSHPQQFACLQVNTKVRLALI